jgi:hypothetical protein
MRISGGTTQKNMSGIKKIVQKSQADIVTL